MTTTVDAFLNASSSKTDVNHLKHFLLNRKARRWMLCEWFYSDTDWCLLNSENEFRTCFEHFFPELAQRTNSRVLNRQQWNLIRRRFGKPRRLSTIYLKNERKKLTKQRNLLRIIQNQSSTHYSSEKIFLHNLPSWIPSSISLGSRVLVRLYRSSEFSLHHGTVISHDRTYQISFDDPNIGILNINDIDIMCEESSVERSLLTDKLKIMKFNGEKSQSDYDEEEEFPLTDDEGDDLARKTDGITNIPDRLLYLIIRVSRILCAKRDSIENLKKMNDQAEFEISRQIPLSDVFRRDYAQLIQWLAHLNEYLGKYLDEINEICRRIVTDEQLLVVFNDPKFVCDRSQRLAKELINKLNIPTMVINEGNLQLITKLVALVVQMKEFSESEGSFLELHAIDQANENFQKSLHPSLLSTYKQCVESSLTQFKSGLNNRPALGLLRSFLQSQNDFSNEQTNHSSINQTFFSV